MGLTASFIFSFCLMWMREKVSNLPSGIFYPSGSKDDYEERLYSGDMVNVRNLIRHRKWDEVEKSLKEITEKAPKHFEAKLELARVLRKTNKLGLAINVYQRLVATHKADLGSDHMVIRESLKGIQEVKDLLEAKKKKEGGDQL